MATNVTTDRLKLLLGSRATARLVTHFVVHPDRSLHFRALLRHTELGVRSLQAELDRLVDAGLVERREDGGRMLYRAVQDHPSWEALRTLVRNHGEPAEVLRDALRDVPGIEVAFVFGSFARDDTRPDSDVDVFILSDGAPPGGVGRAALEAAAVLDRPVNVLRYTREKLARQLRSGGAFISDILAGPKRWIIGSDDELVVV